ncbi:MAG: glycosyltransferase family 4 protein [Nanoarchaeota archaeon]
MRNYANKLRLPFPNAHKTKNGEYDLIHCAHCLSKNKNIPWIADFECHWQFWLSWRSTSIGRKIVKKILQRKNCKKILAWTEECKNGIIRMFPEIENKVDVIYPAVPRQIPNIKRKSREITLLFVGRYFDRKGGLHTLEAFDKITKERKNAKCLFVSVVPEKVLKRYSKNKRIIFIDLLPQNKLFEEVYPNVDIFVYPGYSDTFGFSMLEAMSFGIPTVTVDGYARKELIDDGYTGFIIPNVERVNQGRIGKKEKLIIDEIVKRVLVLIDKPEIRSRMRKNCLKNIETGKFSIEERNKKFERIYSEAIK